MKQFSLLVRVPNSYNSDQAEEVFPEWEKLLDEWQKSGIYVLSFAFPGESYTVSGATKTVKKETVLSDNLKVVSQVIIHANDMPHTLELAKKIPVLPHGGSVEVREIPKPIVLTK